MGFNYGEVLLSSKLAQKYNFMLINAARQLIYGKSILFIKHQQNNYWINKLITDLKKYICIELEYEEKFYTNSANIMIAPNDNYTDSYLIFEEEEPAKFLGYLVKPKIAKCVGCECEDFKACSNRCYWIKVDYKHGVGICSNCDTKENLNKFYKIITDKNEPAL